MEVVQQAAQNIETVPQLLIWLVILFAGIIVWILKIALNELLSASKTVTDTNTKLAEVIQTDLKETRKETMENKVMLGQILQEVKK